MTNSKALFYPSIEIHDENWLKSNLLFWDEIKTIVPESISTPYENKTTAILAERKILKPEIVNPDHHIVRELSENMLEFINTEEGLNLLKPSNHLARIHPDKMARIHNEKFGYEIERLLRMHPSKMTHELRFMLEDGMVDGWLMVDSAFAGYYMTMLANKLCEDKGLRLLTDNPLCSNLSNKVKQGIKGLNQENRHYRAERLNQQLAQGIFTNLAIQRIDFHPSTNVIDILSFKKDHKDALGLFRANMKKLLKDVSPDSTINGLREEVESIYNDEFLPSFNNLKKSLDSSNLKWTCDNFAKVGFFSVSATSAPLYLLGLTVPQALLAGVGVSIVTSLISYNIDKQKTLRENPYNYLLEIERTLQ
jgi:hypothetical protein